MKAVVVEDNPGIREIVVDLLVGRGHAVTAFSDAESAWAWMEHHPFALAMLDWGLPGMDGLELCRNLRTTPAGARAVVLVLTGRAEPEDLDEVVAAGANDYVAKPFKLDALEVRVAFAERQVSEHAGYVDAKATLREAERRYRALVEGVPALTYVEDPAAGGGLVYISPQVTRLMGWTVGEVMTDPAFWGSTLHPDHAEAVAEAKRRANESGTRFVAEYRRRCRNGDYRWFRDEAEPIRDAGGAAVTWHGVISDITDRKLAEAALRESELQHRDLSLAAQRQADQLRLLSRVGAAISTELELSTVFRTVVEATADILGYRYTSLYTIEDGRLVMRHQVGYDDPTKIFYTIDLGQGVIGTVARTGEPLVIHDALRNPLYRSANDDVTDEICVPLHDDGRVAGVFNVESASDQPLTEEDVRLLLGVAELVSAAIARSRLYLEARASERLLRSVLDSIQEVVFRMDPRGTWLFLNRAWEVISGYPIAESLGRPASAFLPPERRAAFEQALVQFVRGQAAEFRGDFQIITAAGETRWVEAHAALAREGEPPHDVTGTLIDITDRKRMEEALRESEDRFRHLALHDPLTALPNRALFMERLERTLADREPGASVFVLFLDLDGFKLVNDSFGHAVGDRLLEQVGKRLAGCIRPTDTIARLGGDEFAVLLVNARSATVATEVSERMLRALRPPFLIDGNEITLAASIGVAAHTGAAGNAADLLRNADTALYAAKGEGRGICTHYEPQMSEHALTRYRQEHALRQAIDEDELVLMYQPAFDLRSGEIVAVEALVRWMHPESGLLPPSEFIGLAESSGLILPLGRRVLRQACREARRWQALSGSDAPAVSVNLSARQIQDPGLLDDVGAALREFALDPALLEFEIVENALQVESATILPALQGLRALGVNLAIDDFGTGFASLNALHELPITAVKIDRRFLTGLGRERANTAILRAIVALARSLDLAVTAEGIETVEQLAHARALGIERGQGFYFTRPLPAEAIDGFLVGSSPLDTDLLAVR